MGLDEGEYKAMNDFKKRVLDLAVSEINEKTDLTVSYTQQKRGRVVSGFGFVVKPKHSILNTPKTPLNRQKTRKGIQTRSICSTR